MYVMDTTPRILTLPATAAPALLLPPTQQKIQMKRFLLRLILNRRYFVPRLLAGLFFLTLTLYKLNGGVKIIIGAEKEEPISAGLTPNSRNDQRACKFPKLLIDDPLIRQHFQEEKRLVCAEEKNWVYTDSGRFYIDEDAVRRHGGEIKCDVLRQQRIDDNHYSETKYENVKNDTPLLGDMLRVMCAGSDGEKYENLHPAVPVPEYGERESGKNSTTRTTIKNGGSEEDANVLMYLLDSVSRVHFMRKLPNFYKFLKEEFKGYFLEGFNIVGDSTSAALIPILTGRFQTELHEARKRHDNATTLDDWPLVFKDFAAKGYVTSYIEEQAWTNALHMRLKGFTKPPTDHYLRPLLISYEAHRSKHKPYCFGDTPESIVWLKSFFRQVQQVYGRKLGKRRFSILFTSETSHDFYNKVQSLDEHLVETFRELLHGGYFDDTFVFVMSDHGHRHMITRVTQSGKWEERLPFLFIRPPKKFCQQHPDVCQNLLSNRDALVTSFDIHATLHHILKFAPDAASGAAASANATNTVTQKSGDAQVPDEVSSAPDESAPQVAPPGGGDRSGSRAISLFEKIPASRTCADADISAHFCSCLEWEEIEAPRSDPLVVGAVLYFLNKVNEANRRDIPTNACADLSPDKIISARYLTPNNKLLAFKESIDYDQLVPDLSDNSTVAAVIYQILFTTLPGPGEWEISVTHFTQLNKYAMSMDSVSRLNRYGRQARCVERDYPHLRMFCYCLRDKV